MGTSCFRTTGKNERSLRPNNNYAGEKPVFYEYDALEKQEIDFNCQP